MRREVGEKGQIVLPKDIREYLNIRPGTTVIFEVRGGEVVIKPEKSGREFVEYFCNTSKKLKKPLTIKELKESIEEQYEERLRKNIKKHSKK